MKCTLLNRAAILSRRRESHTVMRRQATLRCLKVWSKSDSGVRDHAMHKV